MRKGNCGSSIIWSLVFIAQIILYFLLPKPSWLIKPVVIIGICLWGISIIFGWLPMIVFKKRGGVEKGKSYVHTTSLVKTGLYSIIRHPQYTAGLLLSAALMCISQHWIVIALGCIVVVLLYSDICKADTHEIEKFGSAYEEYMKEVPRINFITGIIRLIRRKNREK